MNKKTAKALEASIKHWDENANAKDILDASVGQNNCALCNLFAYNDCIGCPVMTKTGKPYCESSPYANADRAYFRWRFYHHDEYAAVFREAAVAERGFLISLRDKASP